MSSICLIMDGTRLRLRVLGVPAASLQSMYRLRAASLPSTVVRLVRSTVDSVSSDWLASSSGLRLVQGDDVVSSAIDGRGAVLGVAVVGPELGPLPSLGVSASLVAILYGRAVLLLTATNRPIRCSRLLHRVGNAS